MSEHDGGAWLRRRGMEGCGPQSQGHTHTLQADRSVCLTRLRPLYWEAVVATKATRAVFNAASAAASVSERDTRR